MLQLVHLYFVRPAFRDEAFARMTDGDVEAIRNALNSPGGMYGRAIDEEHVNTLARELKRCGGAGGPTADHEHVGLQGQGRSPSRAQGMLSGFGGAHAAPKAQFDGETRAKTNTQSGLARPEAGQGAIQNEEDGCRAHVAVIAKN